MKQKTSPSTIAVNKKAHHDYFLEDRYESGVVLRGWEVKSLRAGRIQLRDSHIILRGQEAWLIGAHISPLNNVPAYINADPTRTRKLLLHQKELGQLIGKVQQKGYTIVPLSLYWKRGKVKCEVALAKGKKLYDKREVEKRRDWEKQKKQLFKMNS